MARRPPFDSVAASSRDFLSNCLSSSVTITLLSQHLLFFRLRICRLPFRTVTNIRINKNITSFLLCFALKQCVSYESRLSFILSIRHCPKSLIVLLAFSTYVIEWFSVTPFPFCTSQVLGVCASLNLCASC